MKSKLMKQNKTIVKLLLSIVIGVISSVLLLFISAFMIVKYDIPYDSIKLFWLPVFIVSGFISGFTAGKCLKSKGLIWGTLTSLIVAVISFLVIFAVNSFDIDLSVFLYLLSIVFFGAVGGIIASNLK